MSFLWGLRSKILHIGVRPSTPRILIDRVIYSNLVYVIALIVDILSVPANLKGHYDQLLIGNAICVFICLFSLGLNHSGQYLVSRMSFLWLGWLYVFVLSAGQGNVVQIEHFFLPFAVLSINLFHPSERKYGLFFGAAALLAYSYFVNRSSPLWDLEFSHYPYQVADLHTNQLSIAILTFGTLLGMSNAYARTLHLLEKQRSRSDRAARLATLGLLAGNIAHEINNPLAIVKGFGAQLQREMAPGSAVTKDMQAKLEKIIRTMDRISATVQSMLSISHGSRAQSLQLVKFADLLLGVRQELQARIDLSGVHFQIGALPKSDLQIRAQAIQLQQALVGLLDHAVSAAAKSAEKEVRVSFSIDEHQHLNIEILSTGGGAQGDSSLSIFEPTVTTTTTNDQNASLGLSLAGILMLACEGELTLLSPQNPTILKITISLAES